MIMNKFGTVLHYKGNKQFLMSFCGSNFRYKKIEKNLILKNDNCQPIENSLDCPKSTIYLNTNVYTGKNYSSIKSLIRRLQATGISKINYPRIKSKNQRTDIFLQGGSINHVSKIDFIQNTKKASKKPLAYKKFTQTRMQWISQSPFQHECNEQVYICKHIPLQLQKQEISKKNQPAKMQSQKNIQSTKPNQPHKTKLSSRPLQLQLLEKKYFSEDKVDGPNSLKFQKTEACLSFKEQKNTPQGQIQRRQITKELAAAMQQNKSQNSIPTYKAQSKRIKISKSIVKSKSELPQEPKIFTQTPADTKKKPLFYLSQDQLRQMNLSAKSFIVLQYPSKQIVTGVYYRQVSEIASLTKIITFYCCLLLIEKYQLKMDDQILIIDQQAEETTGTSAQLQEGDKFTFTQISYGLMLPSGNDAALAMAKWGGKIINQKTKQIDSDLKVFMNYLNTTCQSIGMKLSFFGNPHGLPHPKSGSTAQDVAIVISQALRFPFFRQVIRTKEYRCWMESNDIKREVIWQNTHKLLRREGFIGGKTGITVTAGPCLSTCYEVNDKIYIIVLLKASKISRRFKETRRILAKTLSKMNWSLYKKEIKQIERNDAQLDSDNSEDEQQFNYERNDPQEMKKRMKILTYQM